MDTTECQDIDYQICWKSMHQES